MELGSLFTDVKWKILKLLSEKEMSPLEIAEQTGTTISNVSQQMKLLEAAGILQKRKIPNRDKGKPRTIFSIAKDCSYMVLVMDTLSEKKLLTLQEYHKVILRIWMIEDPSIHYYLEKFYWQIEDKIEYISAILANFNQVIIITDNPGKIKTGEVKIKQVGGETRMLNCKTYTEKQLQKKPSLVEGYHVIYDPEKIISR